MDEWEIKKREIISKQNSVKSANVSILEHPHGGLVVTASRKSQEESKKVAYVDSWYFDESTESWISQGKIKCHTDDDAQDFDFSQTTFLNLMGNVQMMYCIVYPDQKKLSFFSHYLSHDYGKTWKASETPLETDVMWELRNNPIHVGIGRMLLPVYDKGAGRSFAYISDDTGKIWFPSVFIEPLDELFDISSPDGFFTWKMRSPTFVQAGERKILCFLQPANYSNIMQSTSDDFGETWSNASEIEIPSGIGGIDAIRLRDSNGSFEPTIVLAYCQVTKDEKTILKLAISSDIGESWNNHLELETLESPYTDINLIQSDDNNLHIVYSSSEGINHLIIQDIVGI